MYKGEKFQKMDGYIISNLRGVMFFSKSCFIFWLLLKVDMHNSNVLVMVSVILHNSFFKLENAAIYFIFVINNR